MKNKIYLVIIGLLLGFFPRETSGQADALKALLQNKTTFQEITTTFEQYLATMPNGTDKERLEKHFARWAYYQSMHLGPSGEFVNITKKTLEAAPGLLYAPTTSANGTWGFVGPSYSTLNNPSADINGIGRIDRIAFDPSNSSIIYLGATAGGLWKSTNGGTTWTPLSDFIPSVGISGIVIDWSNSNHIYVLTGDGDSFIGGYVDDSGFIRKSAGVMESTDGGTTWEMTGTLSTGDYVGYQLRQHPSNANILLAATSDGIYKTTNGGTTWTQVRAGKHWDIEFKPGTPSTVYASATGAFVYSTNTGDTWNTDASFVNPLCGTGRVELAVTPAASNYVYLLAAPGYPGSNTFCGFYRSTNSGSSFTRLCTSPNVLGTETGGGNDQSIYDIGLCVHPTSSSIVIAAGLCTYKSTNGGTSFSYISTYREGGGKYIHPDIHMVAYNPLNNYLWAVGDGGAHMSTDNGANWTDLYDGIETTQFYHMTDYEGGNQYAILAGCQDNGVKYRTTNTTNFYHIYCCDGYDGVIQYNDVTKGYMAVNDRVYKFTNFTTTSPTLIRLNTSFMQVEMNTSNTNIIYIGDDYIYKYDASTGSTTQLGTARGHWALKTCPSNSSRIYAAGGSSAFASTGSMYLSDDSGGTWSNISGNTGFPASFPRISYIGVEPDNSSHVYAVFSGYTDGVKVAYSSNTGVSWTNISYDLPNIPMWCIVVDANNNAYVGGDMGVYYHAAGSTTWEPFYNYLPLAPVSDLAINETSDQLLASTFGRGIWKSSLRAACPTDVSIVGNLYGPRFYSASNSISMSSQLVGGTGTDVALRAGSYVNLTDGFRADGSTGSTFLGYLGPCDSGMPPYLAQAAGTNVFPQEIMTMKKNISGESGTIEISASGSLNAEVTARIYQAGNMRILLATFDGKMIREVANISNADGTYPFSVETSSLQPGLYYLYLIVNDTISHIQELAVK
jgi:hypothetical protein